MNILLMNAPSDKTGVVLSKLGMWIPGEQLGICYLAACLRREGHSVEIVDAFLEGFSPQEVVADILNRKHLPDLIGLSISDGKVFGAVKVLEALPELSIHPHVTIGGHTASLCASEFLRDYPSIDSVVLGEGERILVELCRRIEAGEDWTQVPGLAFRQDGHPVKNNPTALVDLETLPFPARDNLKLCEEVGFCVSMETSRGCKGACTFCATCIMFDSDRDSWRARSVDSLLEEIERLMVDYGVRKISFEDEDFLGFGASTGIDRAVRFAEEVLRRGLRFSWATLTRVDNVEKEVFTLLKRAGLQLIFIGVENAEQGILNNYGKGTTVNQNLLAIEILKSLDISHEILWIMYDPYTKFKDIQRNVRFLQENVTNLNVNLYNALRVYHGTPLQAKLMEEHRLDGTYLEYRYDFVDQKVEQFIQTINPAMDDLYALMTKINYVLLDRNSYGNDAIFSAMCITSKLDRASKWYLNQVVEAIDHGMSVDGLKTQLRNMTLELALETKGLAEMLHRGDPRAT